MKKTPLCRDCLYCYEDLRDTVYRRERCFFCRRKGPHFSRQYKVGEGTRISPDAQACALFAAKKGR